MQTVRGSVSAGSRAGGVGAVGCGGGDNRGRFTVLGLKRHLVDMVEVGDLLSRRRNVGNSQRQRPVPVESDDFDGVRQPLLQVRHRRLGRCIAGASKAPQRADDKVVGHVVYFVAAAANGDQ